MLYRVLFSDGHAVEVSATSRIQAAARAWKVRGYLTAPGVCVAAVVYA